MTLFEPPTASDTPIWDLWLSQYHCEVLTVSNEIGLFDQLNEKPKTAEELASGLKISLRASKALLGVLCGLKFVAKYLNKYQLTDEGKLYLVTSSPFCWLSMLSGSGQIHRIIMNAINNSMESDVITSWETGVLSDENAEAITKSMHSHSVAAAWGAAKNFNWSRTKKFLDVAGGSGIFAICVAKTQSLEKCTIAELPAVCRSAKKYIEQHQATVDTFEFNMFTEDWPLGYDTHFFSNVFHDWDIETCKLLAKKSFAALSSGGQILVHEMLLNEAEDGELTPATFSLLMFIATKGQQFTPSMLQDILVGVGFVDIEFTHTHGYYSIVSGTKP
eukprot:TRINITY_DN5361_c0_g1_i4.p1 TRINITY_DN5361_c0_g1~~TRINITY_DN5361_c0_g1_i4.p1  ORF type:complete len:332 (-),score=41.26 TRINITY_DN5361_c0_g1_i4:15-1010(-)